MCIDPPALCPAEVGHIHVANAETASRSADFALLWQEFDPILDLATTGTGRQGGQHEPHRWHR